MNSIQAVRIRNLETEVSRLLAENLNLRGQIITQETQPNRSRNFISHVGEVRSELDAKLQDIMALVAKLDRPVKEPRRSSAGTKLPKAKRRNTEERGQMMDALAEQEGRLPAIVENKHYPRRTLEYAPSSLIQTYSDKFEARRKLQRLSPTQYPESVIPLILDHHLCRIL